MVKRLSFFIFTAGLIMGLVSPLLALEKLKLGTSLKLIPSYYLTILAAEEKGIWRENGLEVEWVPFSADMPHMRAVAAGAISIGYSTGTAPIQVAARGLPVVMVAELAPGAPSLMIWVRADSPYRELRDLKGARIGLTQLGSTMHALGRITAKAHGIEKDVRFVGAGGQPEYMAALKSGAVEAVLARVTSIAGLKLQGVVRELASTADYVPKPWLTDVVFAHKDFGRNRPDLVRKVIGATLQSVDHIRKNPRWTMDKIKSFQGLSEGAAKLVYDDLQLTVTGKIDRKAVENIRNVLSEYDIINKEKAPDVDGLFTNEYLPG